jgi:HD-like signal output (HDOD) protein
MLYSNSSILTITDLLRGDLQLASPPTVYFTLKRIVDDPNKSPKDAAFVIENDAALSAKLLKIVNSAFYGFPAKIASIEKAINLIGTRELQNLVLSTIIIERFSDLPGQTFSMHDFWARNLRCAILSREFDQQAGKKYADAAFICGLLHNLGQLLFYRRIPVLAREVELLLESKLQAEPNEMILIEQEVIGFDHFQAGAELCRLWNLPELIIESIRLHAFLSETGPFADIAAIVRLADNFSHMDTPYDAITVNGLSLTTEQIGSIIEKTNYQFEAIFKLFYPSK